MFKCNLSYIDALVTDASFSAQFHLARTVQTLAFGFLDRGPGLLVGLARAGCNLFSRSFTAFLLPFAVHFLALAVRLADARPVDGCALDAMSLANEDAASGGLAGEIRSISCVVVVAFSAELGTVVTASTCSCWLRLVHVLRSADMLALLQPVDN
jgi:hypothetical protein